MWSSMRTSYQVSALSHAYAATDSVKTADEAQTIEAEKVKQQATAEQQAARALYAIQEAAKIEDNTVGYF